MISERLKKLRMVSFDYKCIAECIPECEVKYTPDSSKSRIIRHAEAFCAVMDGMRLNHIPGARLGAFGGDKFVSRPEHLTTEEYNEIKNYPSGTNKKILDTLREEVFFLWPFSDGHIIPGYTKILYEGVDGVIQRTLRRSKDSSLNASQTELLNAMLIELYAVKRVAIRYADFYEKMALNACGEEKTELEDISRMLRKVPAKPASTFKEALQSIWFFHMCIQFDDVSNHSLGRLDQYLYPYYKNDIESGRLTKEDARELFFEFWLKFTPGYIKSRENGKRSEGQGFAKDNIPENGLTWLTLKAISHVKHVDDGQTITLCGYTKDGYDGTNSISHLCIDAVSEFKTFEPKPNIMLTPKTDPDILKKSFELLASGHGLPAIAYYDAIIKGFDTYGGYFDKSDYWNICQIGCVENGIAEKSYTDPMNCFINLPKVLLIMLYGGVINGRNIGKGYSEPKNYEELEENFFRELEYFIDMYVSETNKANPFYAHYLFRPLVSAVVDGCIESATAVDEGGCVYWNKCINCSGFATAVDSLAAIKHIVFDKKMINLAELCQILKNNFCDSEELRLYAANSIPKYGNGDKYADDIAVRLAKRYSHIVKSKHTFIGTSYRPGIYSFYEAVNRMGRLTGATPNGRRCGEKISLNSAPSHGAVNQGLTAVLQSISSFKHSLMDSACTADVNLNSDANAELIGYIVKYLAQKDILFLQLTSVNRKDLENAEISPENYKELTVRVSGFSAQYISLDADTRHEIMERSKWN